MKDGLENIDEIFKQAFDGFESNVDPSVWNNIQSSISSGSGGSSSPRVDPSTVAGIAGKSLALKIVAGIVLVGTVATSAYFIPNLFEDKGEIIAENNIVAPDLDNTVEETSLPIEKKQKEESIENDNVIVNEVEKNVVNNNMTVETSKIERHSNPTVEAEITNESVNNAANQESVETGTAKDNNPTQPKTKVQTQNTISVVKPVELSVNINVDVIKGKAPLTVQFDAIGNGIQYFWDFSDGSDEVNEDSPIHIFSKEGTYRVKLSGLDKNGNSKDVYKTIVVEKDFSSSIQRPLQNIFTPNGDGQNDFYKIRGKNIKTLEIQIQDNQGKVVYTIKSIDDFWDGKNKNGNYVIQGQYYMSGIAIGDDGKKHYIQQAVNVRP